MAFARVMMQVSPLHLLSRLAPMILIQVRVLCCVSASELMQGSGPRALTGAGWAHEGRAGLVVKLGADFVCFGFCGR